MDGFEVLDHLREALPSSHVSIVAVTSHAMVGDRDRILAAGCNGYFEKPIDPDTFVKDVEHILTSSTSKPGDPS
jgi:CheY-like chemotaxis protein